MCLILVSQIAPIYLTSCAKQGIGFLETLLYSQAVQHNGVLLKVIGTCYTAKIFSCSTSKISSDLASSFEYEF